MIRFCFLLPILIIAAAATVTIPARARDAEGPSVTASIGGDVPLHELGGDAIYLSADLGPGGSVKIDKAAPMMAQIRNVWDSRPQITLGGSYPLADLAGLGRLTVSGVVSTAIETPDDAPRPVVGLAKLRLRF